MIKINNPSGFLNYLTCLSNKDDFESIVFSNNGGFEVALRSKDKSQIVLLKWKKDIIKSTLKEKIGIYKLKDFISFIRMLDTTKVINIDIKDNKMIMTSEGNKSFVVNYNTSDLKVINNELEDEKKENILNQDLEYLLSLKIDGSFLKKIKKIKGTIGTNIITFISKDNEVSYVVGEKEAHSHNVTEVLAKGEKIKEFEISLDMDKLAIIPEDKPLTFNFHEQAIIVDVEDETIERGKYIIGIMLESE
jgi:hypothetical protein